MSNLDTKCVINIGRKSDKIRMKYDCILVIFWNRGSTESKKKSCHHQSKSDHSKCFLKNLYQIVSCVTNDWTMNIDFTNQFPLSVFFHDNVIEN